MLRRFKKSLHPEGSGWRYFLEKYKCKSLRQKVHNLAYSSIVSNGKTFTKKASSVKGKDYEFKIYKLAFAVCSLCQHKDKCLSKSAIKNKKGRQIERSEYQDYKDENRERVGFHKDLYRKRQEIIEHQFGTIKRSWGYTYTLMKGKPKIEGEFWLNLYRLQYSPGNHDFRR